MPGAVYVPFIGDGDIAAELYTDRPIYGADLDPQRVEVAARRLPGSTVVVADCDKWPAQFDGLADTFAVADFDAYAYPYHAFRAWWVNAQKADRVAVFFTDGQTASANRPSGKIILPDGTRTERDRTTAEKRQDSGNYWARQIIPWFTAAVAGWRIVKADKYRRGGMLYWGAVLERGGGEPQGAPKLGRKETGTPKMRAFVSARLAGRTQTEAHADAGYSPKTVASNVEADCIAAGLLPDPKAEAAALREMVRTIEDMRAEARQATIEQLHAKRQTIVAALIEAAESGNVPAVKEALDRMMGPEPQQVEHGGEGGGPIKVETRIVKISLADDGL